MRIAGCLVAVVTLFLAGGGFTLACWRGTRSILLAELLGLGWMVGAGIVSLLLVLGGLAFSGPVLLCGVTALCLLLGLVGARKIQRGLRVEIGYADARPWEKWLGLLLLFPIFYIGYASFRDAMVFDGLINWEAKARHAFLAGGSLPASYFTDATRAAYHPRYPLYLPFSELWIYLWAGDCDQTLVKILFPIFYAAAILLLWSSVVRLTGRVWAATLTSLLPIAVPLMADHGFGLVQGYADFPLAAMYLAGIGALLAWRLKGLEAGWGVAVICAALLPWIKQDGILLLASLLAVAALVHGSSQWRRFVIFALPGIAIALFWRLAMHWVHAAGEPGFQPVTAGTLAQNLPRFGTIVRFMGDRLSTPRIWSLLWYWVPVALISLGWRQRRLALWLSVAVFLPLVLDIPAYLFTALDLQFHLNTSFDRLALQISLVTVLCLGLALARPPSAEPPHSAQPAEGT